MPFLGASLGSSPSSKGKSPPEGGFLLPSRSQREASARTKPKAQPHARRRGAGGMDVEEAPTWREIADSAAAPRRSIQRVPPYPPSRPGYPRLSPTSEFRFALPPRVASGLAPLP